MRARAPPLVPKLVLGAANPPPTRADEQRRQIWAAAAAEADAAAARKVTKYQSSHLALMGAQQQVMRVRVGRMVSEKALSDLNAAQRERLLQCTQSRRRGMDGRSRSDARIAVSDRPVPGGATLHMATSHSIAGKKALAKGLTSERAGWTQSTGAAKVSTSSTPTPAEDGTRRHANPAPSNRSTAAPSNRSTAGPSNRSTAAPSNRSTPAPSSRSTSAPSWRQRHHETLASRRAAAPLSHAYLAALPETPQATSSIRQQL